VNLKTIRTLTRYRLNDYEKSYSWLQDEIDLYANEALKTICRDARLIEDSTTESICDVDIENGTLDYQLHESIIYVTDAKLSSVTQSLTKTTKKDIDRSRTGWRTATAAEPTMYLLDYQHGKITIYPNPDQDYTLNLSVIRYPESDLAQESDEPEIPAQYHHAIIDGICYQAYLKWGDRTYDAKKSDIHYKLFRQAIADMKKQDIMNNAVDATMGPHGGFI
jgi:hypothetical protein